MVPGRDTLSTMALHYGITHSEIRQIVENAGVPVIREDGFRGTITPVRNGHVGRPRLGWSDGRVGVDVETTRLTKLAIREVSLWKHRQNA